MNSSQKSRFALIVDELLDPSNIKSSIMVLGVIAVVAVLFGMFNDNSKFLILLKDSEVSRGLITFLVAVTTVLLSLILALYAITADATDTAVKEKFSLGKDVLTTLVGILGTVLGFYFGSAERTGATPPAVAEINFRGSQLLSHISGGTPPYRYSITAPNQPFGKIEARLSKDGWILEVLDKQPPAGTPITLNVSDAKDKSVSLTTNYPAEKPAEAANPAAGASAPSPQPKATEAPKP